MSYVLDALKKSEQERRALHPRSNQAVPAPMRASKSRRFGFPLILIVVALIAGWWVAQWQNIDTSQSPEATYVGSSAVTSVMKERSLLGTIQNKEAQELSPQQIESTQLMPDQQAGITKSGIPVLTNHPNALSTALPEVLSKKMPVIQIAEEAPVFTLVTPASSVNSTYSVGRQSGDAEQQPTIQSLHELTSAEQQSIPAIKIDGHIYDVNPKSRMVIINGKVRKEKQSISSGLSLQEITPDGVILNYQGRAIHIGVFD